MEIWKKMPVVISRKKIAIFSAEQHVISENSNISCCWQVSNIHWTKVIWYKSSSELSLLSEFAVAPTKKVMTGNWTTSLETQTSSNLRVLSKSHAKTVWGPQNLPKDRRSWGRFCRSPNCLCMGFTFLMDANTSKYFYNYFNKPLKNEKNL